MSESTHGRPFKFELGAEVAVVVSGESGTVEGRAQYSFAENNYFVRYESATGVGTEKWWRESALTAA